MLEYVERKGTGCAKWDALTDTFGEDGLLPLWVADMDFKVDKHITQALQAYLDTGVYGYYRAPDSYFDSFIEWEKEVHGFEVERDWIRYSPGVVSGFHIAVNILTAPGDAVLITTPVYYPFMGAVNSNSRRLVCSELINNGGRYYVDFEDFEKKIVDNEVSAFILCSPHNPVSRVWSADELATMLDICRRHNVAVISDEIHHDLVYGDNVHIPTLSLAQEDDRIIMLTSASKTFNIAAFQNSFVVIRNKELRDAWDSFTNSIRATSGVPLGYIAAEAAYTYGKGWLDEIRATVMGNYEYIRETFARELPEVRMTPLEGTYLAWADFGAYLTEEALKEFMQGKCKLAFDYGSWFGGDKSGSFIRINLATKRENIEEMVSRIVGALK